MKFWKHTLLSAVAFLGIASTVLYTSCEKDSCTDLRCKNGGSCAEGFCRCPTGYEGAECEIKTTSRFIGVYYGYTHCDQDPSLLDTMEVYMKSEPNVLEYYRYGNHADVFQGVATGYAIVSPEIGDKYITVTVDHDEITFHVEHHAIPGTSDKSVCTFIGTRR